MVEKIVIVGGGICGARAAFALREKGFAGTITLVGDEPLAPYERPPLSKQTLLDEAEPRLVASLETYAEAAIALVTGDAAVRIDRERRELKLASGASLAYDRLLLATGARPRPFPGLPDGLTNILSLRTYSDAEAIRARLKVGARLVVVGGGFIGLELAATARRGGVEVVLVEGLPRLLSRGVPEEIASVIAARHAREGVDILCDAKIATLDDLGTGVAVTLADGRTIAADFAVVGIGAIPNTGLADDAGLAVDNGVVVDLQLRTSDPAIFAAGDCCSFPLPLYGGRRLRLESWRSAQDQGQTAAANMMDEEQDFASVPWFWSDQYDLTLQIAGLADQAATTVRRSLEDDAFILFHLDADGRLLAASGIGRGNVVARDIRLAEMLIAARARPDPQALASPDTKLKKLLAA